MWLVPDGHQLKQHRFCVANLRVGQAEAPPSGDEGSGQSLERAGEPRQARGLGDDVKQCVNEWDGGKSGLDPFRSAIENDDAAQTKPLGARLQTKLVWAALHLPARKGCPGDQRQRFGVGVNHKVVVNDHGLVADVTECRLGQG